MGDNVQAILILKTSPQNKTVLYFVRTKVICEDQRHSSVRFKKWQVQWNGCNIINDYIYLSM